MSQREVIEERLRKNDDEIIGGVRRVLDRMRLRGLVISHDIIMGVTYGYIEGGIEGCETTTLIMNVMGQCPGFIDFHCERVERLAKEVMEIISREE